MPADVQVKNKNPVGPAHAVKHFHNNSRNVFRESSLDGVGGARVDPRFYELTHPRVWWFEQATDPP